MANVGDSRAAFGPIMGGTILAPDVDAVSASYVDYLGYRISHRGEVTEDMAATWQTPGQVGSAYVVMGPESGEAQWIRLIQGDAVPGYKPMTTYGWHSLEICVADVDAIPPKLTGSPFEIIGPPRNLGMSTTIRAMQVQGAAKEVLYLTQTNAGPDRDYLPNAKSFIDRIFIVVLGSPSFSKSRGFYEQHFDVEAGMSGETRIGVLNRAFGFDSETKHHIGTVKMAGQCLIEIDDYPPQAGPRPTTPGCLPPGVSMCSFRVGSLDDVGIPFISGPVMLAEPPYNGAQVAVVRGVAGELIELIQS